LHTAPSGEPIHPPIKTADGGAAGAPVLWVLRRFYVWQVVIADENSFGLVIVTDFADNQMQQVALPLKRQVIKDIGEVLQRRNHHLRADRFLPFTFQFFFGLRRPLLDGGSLFFERIKLVFDKAEPLPAKRFHQHRCFILDLRQLPSDCPDKQFLAQSLYPLGRRPPHRSQRDPQHLPLAGQWR